MLALWVCGLGVFVCVWALEALRHCWLVGFDDVEGFVCLGVLRGVVGVVSFGCVGGVGGVVRCGGFEGLDALWAWMLWCVVGVGGGWGLDGVEALGGAWGVIGLRTSVAFGAL